MKSTYHHGNLRDTLLEKAIDVLIDKGPKGLSVRAVAKLAGVSEAAPYSHFKNKSALLEAIAVKGYQQLRQSLDDAVKLTGFAMIERLAIGYVMFALENTQLFRLMFGLELSDVVFTKEHQVIAGLCYEPMASEVGKLLSISNAAMTVDEATTSAWSIVHGLSILLIDGKIAYPDDVGSRHAFIAARCRIISLGLSLQ